MRAATEAGQEAGVPGQHKLVQSVERALTMLEEIAASEEPPTASEVARRAGVNRATAWRLLTTLEHFHLVERLPLDGRYRVGYGATRIAAASGADALIRRARPVLERLGHELDESVYLQVASGTTMIVLDEVRSPRPVRVDLPNLEVPLHCGSVGKLFLAFLPEREREEFLVQPHETFTDRTITDPDLLRAELARARTERVAIAYKEHLPDWGGATAVALDRRCQPLAYLNVTVPSYRYTDEELRALGAPLLRAAAELEKRMLPS
ncbi:MAG: IclR family transcriptional regulator [Streptosporangiales bacterium]